MTLPTLTPGDPHRRGRAQGGRVLERRVQLVARARNGSSFANARYDADRDQDDHQQAEDPRRRAAVVAAPDPRVGRRPVGSRRAGGLGARSRHWPLSVLALGPGLAGGRRALVAGHVADHLLADRVGLVAGLALVRLARRGGVRVRVVVEEVVGVAAAPVRGRRRRAALAVRARGRLEDGEPLPAAAVRALGEGAGEVAEQQRRVVADRLRRGDEAERRAEDVDRLVEAREMPSRTPSSSLKRCRATARSGRAARLSAGDAAQRRGPGLDRRVEHRSASRRAS